MDNTPIEHTDAFWNEAEKQMDRYFRNYSLSTIINQQEKLLKQRQDAVLRQIIEAAEKMIEAPVYETIDPSMMCGEPYLRPLRKAMERFYELRQEYLDKTRTMWEAWNKLYLWQETHKEDEVKGETNG